MLFRNLKQAGFDPLRCSYSLFAAGPLHPEQETLELHRKIRDLVAPIEAAVAAQLRADGHTVLGRHPKATGIGGEVYEKVLESFRKALDGSAG
jgi:hypothetical protein